MACVSCYLKGVNDRAMVKPIVLSNYYWDFKLSSFLEDVMVLCSFSAFNY